jgi:hypothetical protein
MEVRSDCIASIREPLYALGNDLNLQTDCDSPMDAIFCEGAQMYIPGIFHTVENSYKI